MGKLVQFQRGSATVIPVCVSSTVSQEASLGRFVQPSATYRP